MKEYTVITVNTRSHVITLIKPRLLFPDANYENTGKALCGILKKGESLEAWKKRTYK